ncbi:MAG: hypothetical protein ACYDCK_12840 [Thermoplasmatota archaeon]
MRLPLALALAFLLLPGCLSNPAAPSTGTSTPATSTQPGPDAQASECDPGVATAWFTRAAGGGGPVAVSVSEAVDITRVDGTFVHVAASESAAATRGNWSAPASALHNLTLADARCAFESVAGADPRWTNVSDATRGRWRPGDYAALLRLVDHEFYALASHDDRVGCADGGTETFHANTQRGLHDVSAYCGGNSTAYHHFASAYANLTTPEIARERSAG